jgi:hypothetical protein
MQEHLDHTPKVIHGYVYVDVGNASEEDYNDDDAVLQQQSQYQEK